MPPVTTESIREALTQLLEDLTAGELAAAAALLSYLAGEGR
jgi:hypothetical protein